MAKALRRQWSTGIALLLEAESHGADWFSELLEHGQQGLWSRVTGKMKAKYSSLLVAASAPMQAISQGGDGSDSSPMMCPELVSPLGQVLSRVPEPAERDDVQYFSPFLGRWYKPGRLLTT
jgi:hypothetical protein